MEKRIIYLDNEKSQKSGFDRQRNVTGGTGQARDNDEEPEEVLRTIQEFQKDQLRVDQASFNTGRTRRAQRREIALPIHVDLIQIHFFRVFDAGLSREFLNRYALTPLEFFNFNKSVLFQIDDPGRFAQFLQHVSEVVSSPANTTYRNQAYNLIALIYKFEFFDSNSRVHPFTDGGVLITLITTYLTRLYRTQKTSLINYLSENEITFSYTENSPDIIEIKSADSRLVSLLADNFDIVKSITASRAGRIRPGIAGPIRGYDFEVEIPERITTVGIIDTGISRIEPLRRLISNVSYNHTSFTDFWDEEGHGTLVSGLVALGDDFYKEDRETYTAKARLFNIKAIHFQNDDLNVPRIVDDIRKAKREHGIRLFNMSLVVPNAKKYNEAFSQFAYELDKIAFEEDVLIFLAVGNFDSDNIQAIIDEGYTEHNYPQFFYNLEADTGVHCCEDTNICVPSESMNNISVGALAGNLEDGDRSDVTPVSIYPAFYTRKFHYDYTQQINKTEVKQKNTHLNKPDFVMDGGDLFEYGAGMEILRASGGLSEQFFGRTCGTSLSTPLLASYAAEILNNYPGITTQSVKALMINSAGYHKITRLPDFPKGTEGLLKSLTGFGQPVKGLLFSTDSNSIEYLIEDSIRVHQIIKIPINLPDYLLENSNKLQFDVAMAFSFMPVKDNHLDYLPLYIAFNIVRDVPIAEVAKKQDSYAIKNGFSWSEDHFGIDNKLFSNAQRRTYRLQPNDIISCGGSVAIAVRCLAKNAYEGSLSGQAHKFSITVRVTEIISNENSGGINLYDEMLSINNYQDISAILDSDLEALL
jgi:subtilisin family serine protease